MKQVRLSRSYPTGRCVRDINAELRRLLLNWANVALAAVSPESRVLTALSEYPRQSLAMLALGKAATGMARGAHQALGDGIESALLIGPASSSLPPHSRWQFHAGDHPLPGKNSIAAGKAIADWLRQLESGLPLLVLISGGGSALAEFPVAGMTLRNLAQLNRWLLASGLDIRRVNAIRSRFSQLKRGGILRLAGERKITVLVISDVPGDGVIDIASGPLSVAPIEWPNVEMPAWLQRMHAELPMPDARTPESHADIRLIARNADALDAIARAAQAANVPLVTRGALEGPASDTGAMIARQVIEKPPGVHLFGGETTVRLPRQQGHGGRNQQLALSAAREIAGRQDILLLALGTDGIDGNTEDAGALVDGGTFDRICDAGLDVDACDANADSNTALAAAGDVIHTGPTGTNVMDLVIALKRA